MESTVKRGRGRGRGTRARGRGRGRGKKAAVVVSSDEETCDQSPMDANGVSMDDSTEASRTPVTASGVDDVVMHELNKENEMLETAAASTAAATPTISEALTQQQQPPQPIQMVEEPRAVVQPPPVLPPTIDMEADISQLEAPTFTTISRGPPEPMLRLKWDHKVNLMGEKVLNPMIHCCDQCDKPILLYGRMIPCKHVFCLKCARAEPVKICPRCNDKVVRVEQSGLGMVFMCTHGGSRYGNTGCRRTYLSQRDLQAHINHRHVTQMPQMMSSSNDIKADANLETHKPLGLSQRKLSESSNSTTIQAASARLQTRLPSSSIGSIAPPGCSSSSGVSNSGGGGGGGGPGSHSSLTAANLARINNANATDCHQGKVALHQTLKKTPITQSLHQPPETVADASYYSSVLNSFGGGGGGGGGPSGGSGNASGPNSASVNPNSAASVGYTYDPSNNGGNGGVGGAAGVGGAGGPAIGQPAAQNVWQQNQYYR